MKVVDAIARILKIEGAEFLSAYPTTPLIEAAAKAEIRPVLCRQERVGVGIADGYARVKNGKKLAAFCMQYGPGAENAFPGVATAYSDSTPMLLLPLGHQRDRAQVLPHVQLGAHLRLRHQVGRDHHAWASQVADVMRRAISLMRMGRPGPAMVEIPADVVGEDVPEALIDAYRPVKVTAAGANVRDVEAAARALREAKRPVIHAGQGVLYAEASDDLIELAELLQAPVMATLEGKSAFPEDHPLSLGTGGPVVTGHTLQYLREADVVFGIGCSLTRHGDGHQHPRGQDAHPRHQRRARPQQELRRRLPASGRRQGSCCVSSSRPSRARGAGPAGREGVRARARARARGVARRMDADAWLRRGAHEPLPGHRRVHAHGRSAGGHRHARFGEPARSAPALLPGRPAAQLSRLGQVARARHRARPRSSGPSSPLPTSSASTSWATPPSA